MQQLEIDYDAIAVEQVLVKVEENASELWKKAALEAVRQTCLKCETFHSDRIWEVGNLPSTREDRALGPILMKAARLGWCKKTGEMIPSKRSHGSSKPQWRSRLI